MRKLSSADIIKIMDITRSCPSCGNGHTITHQCRTTFDNGDSRFCTKGCKHNGYPHHFAACKHNDEAPSCTISVNKIDATGDAERSIPLVETVTIGSASIGIQYDTGCQMSLIPKSVLQQLPVESYSVGKSIKIRVLMFAGEGQIISTTPVRLNLNGFQLKLLAIDADLNNGLLSPSRLWRSGLRAQGVPPHLIPGKSQSYWAVITLWRSPKKKNVTKEVQFCGEAYSPTNPSSTVSLTLNLSPGLTLSTSSTSIQCVSNLSPCKASKNNCS